MIIQTRSITKIFQAGEMETTAIREINMDIREGEFIAVMGPSGCGKSTLLNILGMLDKPSSGLYLYRGEEVSNLSFRRMDDIRRGKIGFVFQNFFLVDELSVFDNIELPLFFMGIGRRERKAKVNEILTRLKISHRSRHFPRQLSGGQQQRVALARAIVTGPELLIADEPTGNLDSKSGISVLHLLNELSREGVTVLAATHSSRDASYAHRLIHLYDGEIVPETLKAKPA